MAASPQHLSDRLAVAEEIRALMGRRRTSQTALAHVLELSQPSLSKRLSGDQAFSLDELLAIAAHFDVEVTALLVGIGQDKSSSPWIPINPGQLTLELEPEAVPDRLLARAA